MRGERWALWFSGRAGLEMPGGNYFFASCLLGLLGWFVEDGMDGWMDGE
jgi:hypothetical protein